MVSEIFRTYILALVSPTSLIGIILILGLVLLWKKKEKNAKITLSVGVALFIISGLAPIRFGLFKLLETPPVKISEPYKYVVVLGAKTFALPEYPISTQLSPTLLARVTEGVRLVMQSPDSILVVTGKGTGTIAEASLMYDAAIALGIPKERIIVENKSMNTKEHPVYLKPILKDDSFVMVTSAYHMSRAIVNFKAHGLNPIPFPTDYMNRTESPFSIEHLIMRGENFAALDRWSSEMYSRLWTFIRMTFS